MTYSLKENPGTLTQSSLNTGKDAHHNFLQAQLSQEQPVYNLLHMDKSSLNNNLRSLAREVIRRLVLHKSTTPSRR